MKNVLRYVKKYRIFVVIPFASMIISIALDMFNPYLIGIMIDRVLKKEEFELLGKVLLGIGIITFSRTILGYIREFTFDYLSTRVSIELKRDIFNHIQSLPFSYFDRMNTGELMSRIGEDVDNVWRAVGFGIGLAIENTIYFITAFAILFSMNWKLALVSLITMPFLAILAMRLEKKIGKAYEDISDHVAVLNTTAQENIAGVRLVKAFAREKHEILKFLELNKTNYNLNMKQANVWGKFFPAIEFISNLCVVMVISAGGLFVAGGSMSIGELVSFNGYIWMLIWPMRMIGWLTNLIAQASASAKKIENIMSIVPEIKDSDNPVVPEKIQGNVVFENVSFKYGEEYVLKNINLSAKAGNTIAIMGTTGSGKTSLINLIGRYYDVCEGRVLVDGCDVRDIHLETLRNSISLVSQDVFLFSESIAENVRLGKENATFEEIKEACREACAHEFIEELEDGYDTVIGERGIGLSGGQKQRISIARALIKDASILILDDATSALDMETEYQLLKNLNNRQRKATTFIIAHRISAVKNADEIIFLENGEIVERGTHQELLNLRGRYYEVYCEQFKDFENIQQEVI
ncbi:ABC transporter ATP-binding protein [Fonticella tunisiensis]|uniref:ATP-binding cassette subfamily B protein n=1 Tax=Fonticella tunisiensis TaxID=1096341 RepID=A0A4R7KER4_9CLOT|nr:ABC transporter ATP-binding protein [Fonticella tunisiensis]TDT52071.1 ATP-binding cassette subfamily B protein [Fonticella tunisiensis]